MNSALGAHVNMQLIDDWTRKLDLVAHTPAENATEAPARLIELQDYGFLRVVNTSTIGHFGVVFAALSYVWGANQTFVLLNTTEGMLTTRFETEQLPQTIQYAIVVTRRIGLRYIWVDAL